MSVADSPLHGTSHPRDPFAGRCLPRPHQHRRRKGAQALLSASRGWINFSIGGDIGPDEEKLRGVFGACITVAAMHREQPQRRSDPDGFDVQISHFDVEIPKILRQLGA